MEHDHQNGGLGTRRFRIWVQGRLDEEFSQGLAGIEQQDVPAGTMLHGVLLDQSQLHSTLDLLRSLGIDVLRFEVDPFSVPNSTGRGERSENPGEALRDRHRDDSTERPGSRSEGHDQMEDR